MNIIKIYALVLLLTTSSVAIAGELGGHSDLHFIPLTSANTKNIASTQPMKFFPLSQSRNVAAVPRAIVAKNDGFFDKEKIAQKKSATNKNQPMTKEQAKQIISVFEGGVVN